MWDIERSTFQWAVCYLNLYVVICTMWSECVRYLVCLMSARHSDDALSEGISSFNDKALTAEVSEYLGKSKRSRSGKSRML